MKKFNVERVEAEKKWWECQWHWWSGFHARETDRVSRIVCEWTRDGDLFNVFGLVVSTTEPTLAEFAAAVKDATGVEIPMPEEEEPQWWAWNAYYGTWQQSLDYPPAARVTPVYDNDLKRTNYHVTVYATTANRNAKRDALLEAARRAGEAA